jgi:hypothetical protein
MYEIIDIMNLLASIHCSCGTESLKLHEAERNTLVLGKESDLFVEREVA